MPAPRRIDRDRIVATALGVIDEDGLDALTMRRVASLLDVEAMSLYNHVPNKDALLDAVHGLMLASIKLPKRGAPWQDQLRAIAVNARAVARKHPAAFSLVGSRPIRSVEALPLLDRLYEEVGRAGLTGMAAIEGCELVVGLVLGMINLESNGFFEQMGQGAVSRTPEATAFPHVMEAANTVIEGKKHDAGRYFDHGLDLVILGVERIASRVDS